MTLVVKSLGNILELISPASCIELRTPLGCRLDGQLKLSENTS